MKTFDQQNLTSRITRADVHRPACLVPVQKHVFISMKRISSKCRRHRLDASARGPPPAGFQQRLIEQGGLLDFHACTWLLHVHVLMGNQVHETVADIGLIQSASHSACSPMTTPASAVTPPLLPRPTSTVTGESAADGNKVPS